MSSKGKGTLVVLSGGQDSTTCLYWALKEMQLGRLAFPVRAICFDYGQKHRIEIECAKQVAGLAGVPLEIVDLGPVLKSTSPLVSNNQLGKYESVEDLPGGVEPTFVPCRNLLFLTLAVNRAKVHGIKDIVTGVCQADSGGYPDCERGFIDLFEHTATRSFSPGGWVQDDYKIKVHTPLMDLTKAESVKLAQSLGGSCWDALASSHTCYDGTFPPCGKCHACHLRARGFTEAGLKDPLIERAAGSLRYNR